MTLSSCTEKPHQKEKYPMNFKCGFRKVLVQTSYRIITVLQFTTRPGQLKTGQTKSLTTET